MTIEEAIERLREKVIADLMREKTEHKTETERLRHELGDAQAWETHLKAEIERLRAALKEIEDESRTKRARAALLRVRRR